MSSFSYLIVLLYFTVGLSYFVCAGLVIFTAGCFQPECYAFTIDGVLKVLEGVLANHIYGTIRRTRNTTEFTAT